MFLKKAAIDGGAGYFLKEANVRYSVVIDDMQREIDNENPPQEEFGELQDRKGNYHSLSSSPFRFVALYLSKSLTLVINLRERNETIKTREVALSVTRSKWLRIECAVAVAAQCKTQLTTERRE